MGRRAYSAFFILALVVSFVLVRFTNQAPTYTDAYYHYNGAVRLASSEGFTETYLWTYIGAPLQLDENGMFPSHLYWMPMTSILGSLGILISGGEASYEAAQLFFILCYALTACIAFALGWQVGKSRRYAWGAGLLALTSPFFARYWGALDTFAPYAFFGASCLWAMGLVCISLAHKPEESRRLWVKALLAGALAGLSHLTRADGLLFILVIVLIFLWSGRQQLKRALPLILMACVSYLLVMLPWFYRNSQALGTLLPVGGTQSIWFREYNELFNFPPEATPEQFFSDGLATLWSSRIEALNNNIGTFVAVEGFVVMAPLMLIGVWVQRKNPLFQPFILYALGMHIAMTFVFAYPGYRGGLFHSASALIPFWAVLGLVGLDHLVHWVAKRRRRWREEHAQWVFTVGLGGISLLLMMSLVGRGGGNSTIPAWMEEMDALLPSDARVMINDPAQLYYFTGRGGVVIPNEAPEVLLQIREQYNIDYLLVEPNGLTTPLLSLWDHPPAFLERIPLSFSEVRLYAIHPET